MTVDGVDFEVVWDGRRPAAPTVIRSEWSRARVAEAKAAKARRLTAARRALAHANRRPWSEMIRNRKIWHALKTPTTALGLALGLCLPRRPVSVLLSKARSAGVVDVVGTKGRRLLYVRAAAYAQAINFPPIPRRKGQA